MCEEEYKKWKQIIINTRKTEKNVEKLIINENARKSNNNNDDQNNKRAARVCADKLWKRTEKKRYTYKRILKKGRREKTKYAATLTMIAEPPPQH